MGLFRHRAMADAETLFAEYQPAVLRYLTRVVGHADAARDLAQDVFLRISRTSIPDADGAELRAWVFRIARNLAFNHLRDRTRRPVAVEMVDQPLTASAEIALAVREALQQLDDVDRDALRFARSADFPTTSWHRSASSPRMRCGHVFIERGRPCGVCSPARLKRNVTHPFAFGTSHDQSHQRTDNRGIHRR